MKKPNVIYIYPDEMRYDTTSFSGNPTCKTPNIDRLSSESAYFNSAHTSFPLCCPFRSSLMTGKYAHQAGMLCNHYRIPLDQEFLPEIMKENGYYTGWVGKWHLNGGDKFDPVPKEYQLGFDEFIGYSRGHNYLESIYYYGDNPTAYKSHKYEPEYQTDQLLNFIDNALQGDKPFLGMICYGLPHNPVDCSPDYYKYMYKPEDIEVSELVPPWHEDDARRYNAMYYGLVTCVDDQVGRIMSHLKEKGIEEDTILILCSDHGDMCYEMGYKDKNVARKGSTHVPFIIKHPKLVKEHTRINQVVDPSISLAPTILDLCGIEIPEAMAGKSLKTAIAEGKDEKLDDYAYYQIPRLTEEVCATFDYPSEKKIFAERGLRTDDFLYVERSGVPYQLFDLKKDPLEKFNFAESYVYLDVIADMQKKLKEVMEKIGDSWDIELKEFPEYYYPHAAGAIHHREVYESAIYED